MAHIGFAKLTAALKKKGLKNPEGAAAAIGRAKYGKAKFQKAAAAGKSMRGMPAWAGMRSAMKKLTHKK